MYVCNCGKPLHRPQLNGLPASGWRASRWTGKPHTHVVNPGRRSMSVPGWPLSRSSSAAADRREPRPRRREASDLCLCLWLSHHPTAGKKTSQSLSGEDHRSLIFTKHRPQPTEQLRVGGCLGVHSSIRNRPPAGSGYLARKCVHDPVERRCSREPARRGSVGMWVDGWVEGKSPEGLSRDPAASREVNDTVVDAAAAATCGLRGRESNV